MNVDLRTELRPRAINFVLVFVRVCFISFSFLINIKTIHIDDKSKKTISIPFVNIVGNGPISFFFHFYEGKTMDLKNTTKNSR